MPDNTAQKDAPSYRLAALDPDFILGDSTRGARFMLEYQKAEDHLRARGVVSTIVVFGSARVREGEPWYEAARQFGRIASERGGALRDWHPADMGAAVLDALVERSGIDPAAIEDVIVGCVSQVGEQSFHVGRNMVMASGLPDSVPAVTVDRQCGSSQQALHFAGLCGLLQMLP